MAMTEDDKRGCCLLEIQETEAKYYRTLEDIEKVGVGQRRRPPLRSALCPHCGPVPVGLPPPTPAPLLPA